MQKIKVIDYGSGNIRSAAKALEVAALDAGISVEVSVTANPADLARADKIVLPGQGAYGDCMGGLSSIPDMVAQLTHAVQVKKTPFLGICVGMQLLTEMGFENGCHQGLGWLAGQVDRLTPSDKSLKIPHMGWNEVHLSESAKKDHFVLRSTDSGAHYYFVHSFACRMKDKADVLATCDYGGEFAAVIGRDNILGVQFHPEKSQKDGLHLLVAFVKW